MLVVPAERSRPRELVDEADHLPSCFVVVPAILGIREHSSDGGKADRPKEIGFRLLERGENGDLLIAGKLGEGLRARLRLSCPRTELFRGFLERRLLVLRERRERLVDEVDDTCFA